MPKETPPSETITSREMRSLELNSKYYGVPRLLLMENAGNAVACETAARVKQGRRIAVFCGLGGNGGDGFVAARHLSAMGFAVNVFIAGKAGEITDKATSLNYGAISHLRTSVQVHEVPDISSLLSQNETDVIIDALLGTGTKGKLRPPILDLVRKINASDAFKIAVDVPTGIDSDTGNVLGEAVKADVTVTFHRVKPGLLKAKKYVGDLVVRSIGIPREIEQFVGPGDVTRLTSARPSGAHKGDFGRLLVIGGSETYTGAPALVALGAMRTGVDLIYVAAPEKTARVISSLTPDMITIKLSGEYLNPANVAELKEHIQRADAVAFGPGLGTHTDTVKTVDPIVRLIERAQKPLLLDADALKAFARTRHKLKVPAVLTPHAGEYAILEGKELPESLDGKIKMVKDTAKALDAVLLLKGNVDIVTNGVQVKLNFTGNPGMTVGGTGDVLSGIIGGLMAQKVDAFEAAIAGAFVNGAAGDFVFAEKGFHMVASDLVEWIPKVLNNPMSHVQVRGAGADTR